MPAASRQQRARGVSRAPSERRRAAVPDSCAHQLPASPKAPAARLTPHGLLALPMPPRNPTVCAPPPLSPPPAPARPACYPAPLTGSAARRFPGLRKRPERLQPRAAYPRHRRRRDIGLCPLTRPPAPPRPARRITTRRRRMRVLGNRPHRQARGARFNCAFPTRLLSKNSQIPI